MLSSKQLSETPKMSLKERMKFFESEAERLRTSPPRARRGLSSSSTSSTCSSPVTKTTCKAARPTRTSLTTRQISGESVPQRPARVSLPCPGDTRRESTTPVKSAVRPGRVSLTRTISGESVVREVVSPLNLPTRTTVSETPVEPLAEWNSGLKSKCRFGEIKRESVEVLEKSCYLATHMAPIENRIDHQTILVLPEDQELIDRDSGVSCSSDDQDVLSDTEVYSTITEMQSVDSGVTFTAAASQEDLTSSPQKVLIGEEGLPDGSQLSAIRPAATRTSVSEPIPPLQDPVTSLLDAPELLDAANPELLDATYTAADVADDIASDLESSETVVSMCAPVVSEDEEEEEEQSRRSSAVSARWSSLLAEEEEEEKVEEKEEEDTLGDKTAESEDIEQNLENAPFHSPFEGTINLSMSAKESVSTDQPPSHKGFLTIFQEESGLGAWNRRWCSVQDNKIYYWLYPEDEVNMNKEPHGEIDLRNCKTERVSVASRLDCARPNTFVLTILTASQPGDRNSIITETNNKTTQTKYLLSADSREERKQWMEVLNKCLLTVISWNH